MKMMRKFSLLVAIALLITVGGVYAQWIYAQGTAPAASDQFNLRLATKTTDTKKGTIGVVGTNFDMMVNDGGNYKAELVLTGSISITFAPKQGAGVDEDVLRDGIPLQYTLSIVDSNLQPVDPTAWKYGETPIIAFPNGTTHLLANGASLKEVTLTNLMLAQNLRLGDFTLDTVAKYTAFNAALQGYSIQITVSEYIPPVTP